MQYMEELLDVGHVQADVGHSAVSVCFAWNAAVLRIAAHLRQLRHELMR